MVMLDQMHLVDGDVAVKIDSYAVLNGNIKLKSGGVNFHQFLMGELGIKRGFRILTSG